MKIKSNLPDSPNLYFTAPNDDRVVHYSCKWVNSKSAYVVTSSSVTIGSVILSKEDALDLHSGNLEILKQFNLSVPLEELSFELDSQGYSNFADVNSIRVIIEHFKQVNEMPFGVFRLEPSDYGYVYSPHTIDKNEQKLIKNKNLKEEVINFFKNGSPGRKNKKGMLLYGPPGNGKTTEVMSLFDLCEELQVRIIIVDAEVNLSYLDRHKKVLGNDRTIFILEEITERTSGRAIEHLLTFLDGENSWNNSITIATTNYPHDLPANLVDRPGRFETFIEYANPTANDIDQLAKTYGFPDDQISNEIGCLVGQGFSFDYVSFILSKAKNNSMSIKETLELEKEKRRTISTTFKGKMGIY